MKLFFKIMANMENFYKTIPFKYLIYLSSYIVLTQTYVSQTESRSGKIYSKLLTVVIAKW